MIHIKEQKNSINSHTDTNLLNNSYFNIFDKNFLTSVSQIKLNSNISYIKQYSCFCTHCIKFKLYYIILLRIIYTNTLYLFVIYNNNVIELKICTNLHQFTDTNPN